MKKRVHFDETVKIDPIKIYILIENGKIREYHGINLTNVFVASIIPNPNIKEGDFDYKMVEMDEDFTLSKVGKYDRNNKGIKANYKIECHELFQFTFKEVYINLRIIDKFRIDYAKRQTIFHEMKFKQKIIYFLIFSIPTLFIGYLFNNSGILKNENKTKSETLVEIIDEKLEGVSIEIIKIPSVTFFIPDSVEMDSLVKFDKSERINKASSNLPSYVDKINELYHDSTLHVSHTDKRFLQYKNELIDKYEQESLFGVLLVDKNKYRIETGIFSDDDILQLINDFYNEK